MPSLAIAGVTEIAGALGRQWIPVRQLTQQRAVYTAAPEPVGFGAPDDTARRALDADHIYVPAL